MRDPIIATAKARMVEASRLVTRAERTLRAAQRVLWRHPGARHRLTLPFWMLDSLAGVLQGGGSFDETAEWLRSDGRHPERSLRRFIAQERREARARARRRSRKGGKAGN